MRKIIFLPLVTILLKALPLLAQEIPDSIQSNSNKREPSYFNANGYRKDFIATFQQDASFLRDFAVKQEFISPYGEGAHNVEGSPIMMIRGEREAAPEETGSNKRVRQSDTRNNVASRVSSPLSQATQDFSMTGIGESADNSKKESNGPISEKDSDFLKIAQDNIRATINAQVALKTCTELELAEEGLNNKQQYRSPALSPNSFRNNLEKAIALAEKDYEETNKIDTEARSTKHRECSLQEQWDSYKKAKEKWIYTRETYRKITEAIANTKSQESDIYLLKSNVYQKFREADAHSAYWEANLQISKKSNQEVIIKAFDTAIDKASLADMAVTKERWEEERAFLKNSLADKNQGSFQTPLHPTVPPREMPIALLKSSFGSLFKNVSSLFASSYVPLRSETGSSSLQELNHRLQLITAQQLEEEENSKKQIRLHAEELFILAKLAGLDFEETRNHFGESFLTHRDKEELKNNWNDIFKKNKKVLDLWSQVVNYYNQNRHLFKKHRPVWDTRLDEARFLAADYQLEMYWFELQQAGEQLKHSYCIALQQAEEEISHTEPVISNENTTPKKSFAEIWSNVIERSNEIATSFDKLNQCYESLAIHIPLAKREEWNKKAEPLKIYGGIFQEFLPLWANILAAEQECIHIESQQNSPRSDKEMKWNRHDIVRREFNEAYQNKKKELEERFPQIPIDWSPWDHFFKNINDSLESYSSKSSLSLGQKEGGDSLEDSFNQEAGLKVTPEQEEEGAEEDYIIIS